MSFLLWSAAGNKDSMIQYDGHDTFYASIEIHFPFFRLTEKNHLAPGIIQPTDYAAIII